MAHCIGGRVVELLVAGGDDEDDDGDVKARDKCVELSSRMVRMM